MYAYKNTKIRRGNVCLKYNPVWLRIDKEWDKKYNNSYCYRYEILFNVSVSSQSQSLPLFTPPSPLTISFSKSMLSDIFY